MIGEWSQVSEERSGARSEASSGARNGAGSGERKSGAGREP